ncbi:MAG: hypothetical protein ACOX55_06230 [Christensenellales bacterium]|jgi:ABC-type glycerol-3-phosphate transport system substrate-binding protein
MMKKLITLVTLFALLACVALPAIAETNTAEPIVVTMAMTGNRPLDCWTDCNDFVKLKEDHNITVDWQFYDDDKFALLLAGGNLPDVVLPRQVNLSSIIENGLALNLDPLLEQYAPNLAGETFSASLALSRKMLGGANGELYFLPVGLGMESALPSETTSRGYRVRWDLYKQLGCPEINSDDDYIKIIKDMVALYPQTEDGRTVYGMGLYDRLNAWYTRAAWVKDVALCIWTFTGSQYMATLEDTTLINGYMNTERSAFWTDMSFYNKLYSEGLLDPDSFIMTADENNSKLIAGQYVAAPFAGAGLYNERRKADPNTLVGLVSVPSANAIVPARKLQVSGGMPTDCIFVARNTQNWEAALTMLNFFADPDVVRMTYNGIRGRDWDYDVNGVPYLTESALADRATYTYGTEEYVKATGIYGQIYSFTMFQGTAIAPDGYIYNIAQMPAERVRSLSPLYRDVADTQGVSRPSEAFMNLVYDGTTIDNLNDYAQLVAVGISDIPMDIQRIMNNLNDILYNAIPSLVMAESEEEFLSVREQVLANLVAADEATAWAWCESAFNASKEIMKPLFEEARDLYLATAK